MWRATLVTSSENEGENKFPLGNNNVIISKGTLGTWLGVNDSYRIAPSDDLGFLFPCRSSTIRITPLHARTQGCPAYSTLPVEVGARVAETEEANGIIGIRDEEDVSNADEQAAPSAEGDVCMRDSSCSTRNNQAEEYLPDEISLFCRVSLTIMINGISETRAGKHKNQKLPVRSPSSLLIQNRG